jgi:PAS domain S-box-containing protein
MILGLKFKIPLIVAVAGAVFGYFVLSPFSMFMAHEVHINYPMHQMTISEVFKLELLQWTLPFTFIGGILGFLWGILFQRVREKSEEIKKEKEYTEQIVNSMDEGLLAIDRDYRIVSANRAFLKAVGMSLDEVKGKRCYGVSHGESKPCSNADHMCPLKEVLETGKPATVVHTHYDSDGKEIYIELTASPVRDDEGNIIEVIELSRNITEGVEAQEALQVTEERLRSIVESSEDIIVMQDLDGKYLYYNAPPKYGLSKEDVVGKTPHDIVSPEAADKIMEQIKKAVKSGESFTFKEEGSWGELAMWAHVQISPIKDSEGNVVAVTTILRNITEIQWAELGLKKYIEDLEKANQMKDLFTDIMTHDLLSPAGAIKNSVELLLEDAKGEEKEFLEVIEWGADKQMEIIELTSMLSKLESSEEIEKQPLDLRDVIDRAVKETKHRFEKAGMKVENNITAPVQLNASPIIEEVFLNLLTNAARYAADGKKVVIEAMEEDESYTISVKDFGPGLPDRSKKDIFERFRRREKESVKGTGLGLTIAKRVVEIHGGKIWVEDNPEGGAIFKVSLPKPD